MEESLRTLLLGTAGVTAIAGTRIDWGISPQGAALPRLVLTEVGAQADTVHSGPSGLRETRVQIDCWAATFKAAKQLARAVEAALIGRRFTQGTTKFSGAFLDASRSFTDTVNGDPLFRTSLDVRLWSGATV